MVKGLSESYGANREGLRRSEILPVAESTVNRLAQQTDVCSTQDDKTKKDDKLRGVAFYSTTNIFVYLLHELRQQ